MSKESTIHLFRRLEQLNGIGAALSRERDIDRLLENILEAAKTITGADGGTLYSVTEDQSALKFEILRTDSLGIRLGGTTGSSCAVRAGLPSAAARPPPRPTPLPFAALCRSGPSLPPAGACRCLQRGGV